MRPSGPNGRDLAAARIAEDHHGVAHFDQLRAAGVSAGSIKRSREAGRLHPVFPSVYAVGHCNLTVNGWCQAALLTCGDESVLGDHTAARQWHFGNRDLFPISVYGRNDRGRKLDRIRARRIRLDPADWMTLNGLRVTTPARTLVDLAGEVRGRAMRRHIERAQDVKRFDPAQIRQVLERNPRRPGCRPLLTLTDLLQPDHDGAKSYLERHFLQLVRRHRLPLPEVNVVIEGRERDFVWRGQRLVVEADGYAHHSTKVATARDKRRDRELSAALWRPARFTYEEIVFEESATIAELRTLLAASVGA